MARASCGSRTACHAIDDLWSALTDPRRLARWIGEVEGDLRLGGEFSFSFFATGSEGTGRVEACEPPRRLLVTMALDQPDEDVIEATLAADGDQTILVWEERGMPVDQLAGYGAGVQIHVEDLAAYLAGRERRDEPPGSTSCSLPLNSWPSTSASYYSDKDRPRNGGSSGRTLGALAFRSAGLGCPHESQGDPMTDYVVKPLDANTWDAFSRL